MTNKDAPSPNVEAALAQPDAKSQNVQEALNEALRFLDKIDHWVSAKYATLAARKICDVLEKLPALAQSDAGPHRDPDDTKVICPNCTHQFRAISVMDQARLAQSDAEPKHDVREAFMQVLASLVAAVSLLKNGGKAAKKAAPSDKMFDQMILDYEKAIEQGRAALAQSDAEPKHDVRVTDAMVEAAGEAWLRARLNIGPDGLTEECWSEILSAMRVVLAAALARAEEKPDASGLIEVLAGDLGLILRGLIAKYHGPLLSRATDRGVHGELILDCPTNGIAARQGNGG